MKTEELAVIQESGAALIAMANHHGVENQTEADEANEILKKITHGLKLMEEKRKSFTAPLNQSLKEINETFKQMALPVNAAKTALSDRLMSWRRQEQARIDEERAKAVREEERRRKIQEAHAAKGHVVKEDITPVAKPIPFSVNDTTKTRLTWTYEIEDDTKIPRDYLTVNGPAITQAVRAGVRDIPGVKIYQKETAVFG